MSVEVKTSAHYSTFTLCVGTFTSPGIGENASREPIRPSGGNGVQTLKNRAMQWILNPDILIGTLGL